MFGYHCFVDLLVLAKEPIPGRVKTRLCPPCTPQQAAAIATAALADTLAAAVLSGADRVVLGLDGEIGEWCPPGIEVVDQGQGALSDRLTHLWSHARGPAFQIGMDTPQLTASFLDESMARVASGTAAFGLAEDGGWWGLGLPHAVDGCFDGIATSQDDTGALQHVRLLELGFDVDLLPSLRDVDLWSDALAVSLEAPQRAFARAVTSVAA